LAFFRVRLAERQPHPQKNWESRQAPHSFGVYQIALRGCADRSRLTRWTAATAAGGKTIHTGKANATDGSAAYWLLSSLSFFHASRLACESGRSLQIVSASRLVARRAAPISA